MSIPNIRYDLDTSGLNPNNKVVGELRTLSDNEIRAVAPSYGAYFTESLVVKDNTTQLPLVREIDYYCVELLQEASAAYGKEICYLILIINQNVTEVTFDYQVLGGLYTRSADKLVDIYEKLKIDDRPVDWIKVLNKPYEFEPTKHLHDLKDVYGFQYLIDSMERIREAILLGSEPANQKMVEWINSRFDALLTPVQADWNEAADNLLAFIKNKPAALSAIGSITSGIGYLRRNNNGSWSIDSTIGVTQPDWNQTDNALPDFIKNKPTLFSGSYGDLSNIPASLSGLAAIQTGAGFLKRESNGSWSLASVEQADWNETDNALSSFIKNKPTIPNAQIQSDWNQTTNTALDFIKNKPDLTALQAVSGTVSGVVNNVALQELGGKDKLINTVRIGRGNSNIASNTVLGASTLGANTTGYENIAVGWQALKTNTTGYKNTAIGVNALRDNTTGYVNVAIGGSALLGNTTGFDNIAIGYVSMQNNTTGFRNAAIGLLSLASNNTGYYNTTIGTSSMQNNTDGYENTAMGWQALYSNSTASYNVAIGSNALFSNSVGTGSVAIGYQSGLNVLGNGNTIVGHKASAAGGGYSIANGTIQTAGTGYTNGTFGNVPAFSSTVNFTDAPTFTISVSGGVVTGVTVIKKGSFVSDPTNAILSFGAINGAGSGFTWKVLTPTTPSEYSTAIGYEALYKGSKSGPNDSAIAIGYRAMYNGTVNNNLAIGNFSLYNLTTGMWNTAIGNSSLNSITTGNRNTAIGFEASYSNMESLDNTAVGHNALRLHTGGHYNVAIGTKALSAVTDSYANTAVGAYALWATTQSTFNTAIGAWSLTYNTTGNYNTAAGAYSMYNNTTGGTNTALGRNTLYNNTTGSNNIAVGHLTMASNTVGNSNISIGGLASNKSGNYNVGLGSAALYNTITGNLNTGIGHQALNSLGDVVAGNFKIGTEYTIKSLGTTNFTSIGATGNIVGNVFTATGVGSGDGVATTTANYNTVIGGNAGYYLQQGENNIIIGYDAQASSVSVSNEVTIGNDNITSTRLKGKVSAKTYFSAAATNVTTFAVDTADVFSKTVSSNTTFAVSGTPASGLVASFIVDLTNGGAFPLTWWANVKWENGIQPILTVTGRDVLGFFTYDGGATWTGIVLAKDVK